MGASNLVETRAEGPWLSWHWKVAMRFRPGCRRLNRGYSQ